MEPNVLWMRILTENLKSAQIHCIETTSQYFHKASKFVNMGQV